MSQDTRQNYEKHLIQRIVRLVQLGEIQPNYKTIGIYAKMIFHREVSQSTMANWFQNAGVTLASVRRNSETPSPQASALPEIVPVDYFLNAPGVYRRSAATDLEFMKDIIYAVVARIYAGKPVSIQDLIILKLHMSNISCDYKDIEKRCRKFALTYRLPDVDYGRITFEQYLNDVYVTFPSLRE